MVMVLIRFFFFFSLIGGMDIVLNFLDIRGVFKLLDDDWREMLCFEKQRCLYLLMLFICMIIVKDIKIFSM